MSPDIRATYRVQLHKGFTFYDAATVVPYLARLGITHLYCSPYLQATPGSTHGYDVVDHTRLNDELGGEDGHAALCEALAAAGLSQVVDIVPNHMAVSGRASRLWWDVLKHGRRSRYAHFFDIEWEPPDPQLRGKVLLPVLGDELDDVLARHELSLATDDGETLVRYFDHEFPVAPGTLGAGDDLRTVLERQHYRLSFWRHGDHKLNYRRFFDVKTLGGLRAEDPEVFRTTHGRIVELVEQGKVEGVRVDHIDGLRDPTDYLETLRAEVGDVLVLVEKILEPGEELPHPDWPVDGTTGYEFANASTMVLIDPDAEAAFTDTYRGFTGNETDAGAERLRCKLLVLSETLAAEVERLARLLGSICATHGIAAAHDDVAEVVREAAAAFPVYRTYIDSTGRARRSEDAGYLDEVLDTLRERVGHAEVVSLLADVFHRRDEVGTDPAALDFMLRFQQLTGPAMAKGFEDTALYRFNRFVALNEVGGDPSTFGMSPAAFHEHNEQAQERRPRTLLATSTHDTKRSEDVRARLAVLSEMPDEWRRVVAEWAALNARHKQTGLPDANTEYLLYQTLVGAHPLDEGRAVAYMEKASKEAKQQTAWTRPDEAFDDALAAFVRAVLGDDAFVRSLEAVVERVREPGWVNSLSATLLKLTSPGIPDIYQGTELWDLSLVDPDNRRPVDYEQRSALLERAEELDAASAWEARADGAAKLWLTARTLTLRRELPDAFGASGSYERIAANGSKAAHVIAYVRGGRVAAVVPRLPLRLNGNWDGTRLELPRGRWVNVLTEQAATDDLRELLHLFPVALLTRA